MTVDPLVLAGARRLVRKVIVVVVVSWVGSCGPGSSSDEEDGVERKDLTLTQATVKTVSTVDTAARRLGTIVVPGNGETLSCADLPDEGDPVQHSYGLAVTASAGDVDAAIDGLARDYEAAGWVRSRSSDGRAVNLDRDGYRLQIESAQISGRIIVGTTSPCVSAPE